MNRILLLLVIISLSVSSCIDKEKEDTLLTQEENIDTYFNTNYPDSTIIRNDGSNKVIITNGTSDKFLAAGDSVYFNYAIYIFSSTPELFDTNLESVAKTNNFIITYPTYTVKKIIFNQDNMIPGLFSGMSNMKEGEHSIILFSAKYGYYDDNVGIVPSMSALMYEIWITQIKKN
ncbi:MAG: FKBP-type peptidyl-prolyl cis-trans isomerase [Bacteroidales bacterium]